MTDPRTSFPFSTEAVPTTEREPAMPSDYKAPAYESPANWVIAVFLALVLLAGLILACWVGFGSVSRWNKERNFNTNRKDIVIEAQAQADAAEARTESEVAQAERLAERDRIRARGQADANVLLQDSLTPEYLAWYWIDGVRDSGAQLIYVPVDPASGQPIVPLTEAGRGVAAVPEG